MSTTLYTTLGIELINEDGHLTASKTSTAEQMAILITSAERMAQIKINQSAIDDLYTWLGQFVSRPAAVIGPSEGRLASEYADHPFTDKQIKTGYLTNSNTCQWLVADYGPSYEICGRPVSHHRG